MLGCRRMSTSSGCIVPDGPAALIAPDICLLQSGPVTPRGDFVISRAAAFRIDGTAAATAASIQRRSARTPRIGRCLLLAHEGMREAYEKYHQPGERDIGPDRRHHVPAG